MWTYIWKYLIRYISYWGSLLDMCLKYNDPTHPPEIGSFVTDAYEFVYGTEIPRNVFVTEVRNLQTKIKAIPNFTQKDINNLYEAYIVELLNKRFNHNLDSHANFNYKCWLENTMNTVNNNITNKQTVNQLMD